jgi:hypothetical protein
MLKGNPKNAAAIIRKSLKGYFSFGIKAKKAKTKA